MTTQVVPGKVVGNKIERRRIIVRGIVQGVGYRPFVARLAADLHVQGHCGNDDSSVFVEAEGPPAAVDAFVHRLRTDAPPLAAVVDIRTELVTPLGDTAFAIVASRRTGTARTLVPPDVGICDDCLREFDDPRNRRYRHPFINCTNCGPRFTVITDLPYDRPATTMADFPMCERCRAEYDDPRDRRYHAQPISCHDCGPRLSFDDGEHEAVGDAAVLARAQAVIAGGGVLAVKGIGGFHLVCDARSSSAVDRLRHRKRRPHKPFAVMAPDVATVRRICDLSPIAIGLLTQPARPIVLLRKSRSDLVCDGVAPGLDELGVLLPYTGIHHLLFGPDSPALLVMTSGNLTDEPLCFADDDARTRLGEIADAFLLHDRPIAVPCEDSVLAAGEDVVVPIRRSRGFAPLPVALPRAGAVVLGVGAEVKNTFCLTRQDFAFCSAHLGDMGSLESQAAFDRSVEQLVSMHRASPEIVVADDHPGYSTRRWAQRYSEATGVPLETVQHHHAHVASLLAEHGRLGTDIVGIAFDGTGFGCDATVWGGELIAVRADWRAAERAGHLQPFWLPGGDAAVRNPARVALALLYEAGMTDIDDLPCIATLADEERALVESQLRTGVGCARTTSMGRLFDGIASMLDVRHRATYEAQAAIELEALARTAVEPAPLRLPVVGTELRFGPLLEATVTGVRDGRPAADLALGFHHAIANATAELTTRVARERGIRTVGLTGGVFQNRILLRGLRDTLHDRGFDVLTHRAVPPNDGGLSLGQAVIGTAIAAMGRE